MEWGDWKYSLCLIGILILILFWIIGDRFRALLFSNWGDRDIIFPFLRNFSPTEVVLKRLLLGTAFVLLTIGLMQPRELIGVHKVKSKVLNLVFALDCSYSMLAQDLKPSRLTRAKIEISTLLQHLQGDRVALVVFAGQSLVQCPLTEDYYAFKRFLDAVSVDTVPTPGTNISSALDRAYSLLKKDKGEGVVVLITDGEDFYSNETIKWAKKYKKEGIKVYCIGIGSKKGEPIPLPNGELKRDKDGNVVLTHLDEDLLIRIAQMTGGAYLRASASSLQIEKMYRLISKEHRSVTEAGMVPEYAQYYVYPLSVALILLFFAWFFPISLKNMGKMSQFFLLFFSIVLLSGWSIRDWKVNRLLKRYQKGEKDVVETLEELRQKYPADPNLNYNLGTIKAIGGKEAEKFLDIAAQSDSPVNERAFYNLGNYYLKENRLKEAVSAYKQALILNPNSTDARYNLELALKRLKVEGQKNRSRKQQENQKGGKRQQKKKSGNGGQESQNRRNSQQQSLSNQEKKQGESEEKQNAKGNDADHSQLNAGNKKRNDSKLEGNQQDQDNRMKQAGKNSLKEQGEDIQGSKEIQAILSALREEELSPSQVNKRKKLRGEYDVDKDW